MGSEHRGPDSTHHGFRDPASCTTELQTAARLGISDKRMPTYWTILRASIPNICAVVQSPSVSLPHLPTQTRHSRAWESTVPLMYGRSPCGRIPSSPAGHSGWNPCLQLHRQSTPTDPVGPSVWCPRRGWSYLPDVRPSEPLPPGESAAPGGILASRSPPGAPQGTAKLSAKWDSLPRKLAGTKATHPDCAVAISGSSEVHTARLGVTSRRRCGRQRGTELPRCSPVEMTTNSPRGGACPPQSMTMVGLTRMDSSPATWAHSGRQPDGRVEDRTDRRQLDKFSTLV
jgi:hypothetical protein